MSNEKKPHADTNQYVAKGSFTLSLAIAIPKNDSLAIAMLAKEMAYPTHSLAKFLAKICLFPQA